MNLTFVIPDIHGDLSILLAGLDRVDSYPCEGSKRKIFLGDYIDRGANSAQVVSRVRKELEADNFAIALSGNHEDFMASTIVDGDENFGWSWRMNGGVETVESYGGDELRLADDATWMKSLPIFHEDKFRVYVHAFAPEQHTMEDAPRDAVLWARYPEGANVGYRGKHVVHGHTPKKNGPELLENRTNLDCGAVFWGRLVIGVFDDDIAGGPIDLIEATK